MCTTWTRTRNMYLTNTGGAKSTHTHFHMGSPPRNKHTTTNQKTCSPCTHVRAWEGEDCTVTASALRDLELHSWLWFGLDRPLIYPQMRPANPKPAIPMSPTWGSHWLGCQRWCLRRLRRPKLILSRCVRNLAKASGFASHFLPFSHATSLGLNTVSLFKTTTGSILDSP